MISEVGMAALAARNCLLEELAVENVEVRECLQRLQKESLSAPTVLRTLDDRREIFDCNKRLIRFQQVMNQCINIHPIEALPTLGPYAIVEVIAIHIRNNAFQMNVS